MDHAPPRMGGAAAAAGEAGLQRGVRARRRAEHGDVVEVGDEDAVGVLGRYLL